MAETGFRLGIDFGTSNTVAVLRWPDGRTKPLLFDGSPLLPSAVYLDPGGAILTGRDAVHSARLQPHRFEPYPKRRVEEVKVWLGEREIAVVDLVATVLRRVGAEAHRVAGAPLAEVNITHPAAWAPQRRETLSRAAIAAELPAPFLTAEPIAAASYFVGAVGTHVPAGGCAVVYDFGAGTFDASVVRRNNSGGFDVLSSEGLPDAGGLDVDAAVVAYLGRSFEADTGDGDAAERWRRLTRPADENDRRAAWQLWEDARLAKEMLSRAATTYVHVPLFDESVPIGREQLETLARPILDRTVTATQLAVTSAGLTNDKLSAIFLVGGSSRIPLAATLLHRAFGAAPTAIEQPELVVAEGALYLSPPTGRATVGPVSGVPAPSSGGPSSGGLTGAAFTTPSAAPGLPPLVPTGQFRTVPPPTPTAPPVPTGPSGPPVSAGPRSAPPGPVGPPVSAPPSGFPVSAPPGGAGTATPPSGQPAQPTGMSPQSAGMGPQSAGLPPQYTTPPVPSGPPPGYSPVAPPPTAPQFPAATPFSPAPPGPQPPAGPRPHAGPQPPAAPQPGFPQSGAPQPQPGLSQPGLPQQGFSQQGFFQPPPGAAPTVQMPAGPATGWPATGPVSPGPFGAAPPSAPASGVPYGAYPPVGSAARPNRRRGLIMGLTIGGSALAVLLVIGLVLYLVNRGDGGGGTAGPSPSRNLNAGGASAACGYKLAYLGVLTGDNSADGIMIRDSAKLAVAQYNAKHDGCQVTLDEFDTQRKDDLSASVAQQVADDPKILGVIGPVYRSEVLAAGPILNDAGVPLISPAAADTEFSRKNWKVWHRVIGTDADQAVAGATYLKSIFKSTKTYIVYDDTEFGATASAEVRRSLGDLVTGEVAITRTATDFSAAVKQVTDAGADSVYFAGYFDDGGTFVKQLRTAKPGINIVSGDKIFTQTFVDTAGKDKTEGVVMTSTCIPADQAAQNFASQFKAKYGEDASYYGPESFDATNVFLSGLAAGKATRKDMLDYVNGYQGKGVSRDIKFTVNGDLDVNNLQIWAFKVENGNVDPDQVIPGG